MSEVRLERDRIDSITKFEKETEEEVIRGAREYGLNRSAGGGMVVPRLSVVRLKACRPFLTSTPPNKGRGKGRGRRISTVMTKKHCSA